MKNKKEITIYYFSATGNSLKIAMDIASAFTAPELFNMNKVKPIYPGDHEAVGFIFPVYMGTLPDTVYQFLQHFPFNKNTYYFSIATYYLYKGCAIPIVGKILKEKGVSLRYGNNLSTVGNCLMEYEVSVNKRLSVLQKAEKRTMHIVNDIKEKAEKTPSPYFRLAEKFHKWLFQSIFGKTYKQFTLEENCTGCETCTKVCPAGNISLKENKPTWGTNCKACHACVHWCPQNAINLGRSKGRLQYNHLAITIPMIVKKQINLSEI